MLWRIVVGLAGAWIVAYVLLGAVRTVIVPRSSKIALNMMLFWPMYRFSMRKGLLPDRSPERREARQALFAPMFLILLPVVWATGVVAGFTLVLWSLGGSRPGRSLADSAVLAGSSLTTLGFRTTEDLASVVIEIVAALIGLGLVALLISFLPTIYGNFSAREHVVSSLSVIGSDHDVVSAPRLLMRAHEISGLNQMQPLWETWREWFVTLEETHSSFQALVFFRSPDPARHWLSAAAVILDSAALYESALDQPPSPRASLCIRSGFESLRRMADAWDIAFDPDPQPTDEISVSRAAFDEVFDAFADAGLPVVADRAEAYRSFAGWRVNYDAALLGLVELVQPPLTTPWLTRTGS